jgi:hypothetical protein
MKFEINKYLLRKMGWVDYYYSTGIGLKHGLNLFESDDLVRFFIDIKDRGMCFLIKELSDFEKQKSKNTYKFIIADYKEGLPDISFVEFNSNDNLFKLVIKHEACNGEYERHFKINKLLNNK